MGIAQIANTITDPSSLMDLFVSPPIMLGELQIDVLVEESPSYDYEVTDYPVEAGVDITDHVLEKPVAVTLDIILTDVAFDPLSVITGAITGSLSFDTWQDKKAILYEIRDTKKQIDVSTPSNFYPSFIITSIRPLINKNTSGGFFATVELKAIRTVSSAIANIDPSLLPPDLQAKAAASAKKAASKAPKGAKAATEGGKGASILKKIKDGLV